MSGFMTEQLGETHEEFLATVAALPAGSHADGGGLYFVKSETSAHWQFRYTLAAALRDPANPKDNGCRKMSLGIYPIERDEDQARELHRVLAKIVKRGGDPRVHVIDAVKPQGSPVFKAFAQDIVDKVKRGLKNEKSRQCWQRSLDKPFALLHAKQLHQITFEDVVAALEPIWLDTPVFARNCRQRLEYIFDAGKRHMPQGNPALFTRELKRSLPKGQKAKGKVKGSHASLSYRKIAQFWTELCAIKTVSAKCLQLQILTCVRSGEAMQMAFQQIKDYEHEAGAKHWVIPNTAMKNGLPANVPMTPRMLQIVDEMRKLQAAQGIDNPTLVFPGRIRPGKDVKEGGERTMLKLVQETLGYNGKTVDANGNVKPKITVHGMRATFRSWAFNTKGNDWRDAAEYCLHHIDADDSEAAYIREDMFEKRRQLLLEWEAVVTEVERGQITSSPQLRLVA